MLQRERRWAPIYLQSTYLPTYLPTYLHPSIHPSIHLSIYISIILSIYLPIYLSKSPGTEMLLRERRWASASSKASARGSGCSSGDGHSSRS
eukprot:2413644-Rhodomonas_salina.1